MRQQTWKLVDHLCMTCGGRILQCISGGGPTPGGNPIFRCADCGNTTSGFGPQALCWCGFSHRGQNATAYKCLPFSALKQEPRLLPMFLSCGCDPNRKTSEVGIVLESDYTKLRHP